MYSERIINNFIGLVRADISQGRGHCCFHVPEENSRLMSCWVACGAMGHTWDFLFCWERVQSTFLGPATEVFDFSSAFRITSQSKVSDGLNLNLVW